MAIITPLFVPVLYCLLKEIKFGRFLSLVLHENDTLGRHDS